MAVLAVLFIALAFSQPNQTTETDESLPDTANLVRVFFSPECPHCHEALQFLNRLKKQYPSLKIKTHNINRDEESDLMMHYARQYKIPPRNLGVPFIIIGNWHYIGFDTPETTGKLLKEKIETALAGLSPDTETKTDIAPQKTFDVPLLGKINLFETSLPALAIILGLLDGFNPCAMWVLVYLISLIIGLRDRTKIYTLVGTFLMASGILYFLFMTAWLNAFLFLGYIYTLTVLIGLAAIYMGIISVRDFIKSGGQLVCEVGDIQSRQQTRSRIQELVASPLSWISFTGIVGLAFAVNSIEFICSSAIPAVFTHVLTVTSLSTFYHYFYISIYVLAFMLDDLIIFSAAIFAADRFAGEKYAGLCKVIGSILMIGLGAMLAFFPNILR